MNCPNCGAILTCGCQSRTASNGAKACVHCILSYEGALAQQKQATQAQGIAHGHVFAHPGPGLKTY